MVASREWCVRLFPSGVCVFGNRMLAFYALRMPNRPSRFRPNNVDRLVLPSAAKYDGSHLARALNDN